MFAWAASEQIWNQLWKLCSENETAGILILDQDLSLNISKSQAFKQVLKSIFLAVNASLFREILYTFYSENSYIYVAPGENSVLVER